MFPGGAWLRAFCQGANHVFQKPKMIHDLSDAFWNGLAPHQHLEIVQEVFN